MIALTIEQMKVLQEKGLDCSKASMYWITLIEIKKADPILVPKESKEAIHVVCCEFDIEDLIPTFILEDILNILPVIIKKGWFDGEEYVSTYAPDLHINGRFSTIQYDFGDYRISFQGEPLEIAYNMLIWCLDNKYIE